MARYPNAPTAWNRAGSDPKAVEIADKVVANYGGMDKWAAVKQIQWGEAIVDQGKPPMEGEQAWDRWNARTMGRLIGDHGDVVVRRELYGEYETAYGESGGKRQKMDDKESPPAIKVGVERWQFSSVALSAPFLMEEVGTVLKYNGQAAGDPGPDGQPTPIDMIGITFDAGEKARAGTSYVVGVDPKTNMIVRLEVVASGGNIAYKPDNLTEVNGMKFPTVEHNIGLPTEHIEFKNIKIGEPEDSLYSVF
ncbi:MAG: hypothetical protein QM831_37060 [Kofleriaceae bacterium]